MTENHVFPVEPGRSAESDKELGIVGVPVAKGEEELRIGIRVELKFLFEGMWNCLLGIHVVQELSFNICSSPYLSSKLIQRIQNKQKHRITFPHIKNLTVWAHAPSRAIRDVSACI